MRRVLELEVNDVGVLEWPDGELSVAAGAALSLDGHPPLALMEVAGDYARTGASSARLSLSYARLSEMPLARLARCLLRASVERGAFDYAFEKTKGVLAAERSVLGQSLRLRIAVLFDDAPTVVDELRGLLRGGAPTDEGDSRPYQSALEQGWRFLKGAIDLDEEERVALAETLNVGPWKGPALTSHDTHSLSPWVDFVFEHFATPDERKPLRHWQSFERDELEWRVENVEHRDEERREVASDANDEVYWAQGGDPCSDYGPPREPHYEVVENAETLPVLWAKAALELERERIPSAYGFRPISRQWSEGFGAAHKTVTILSSVAPSIARKFRSTRARHMRRLHSAILFELRDETLRVLVAPQGMFGEWYVRDTTLAEYERDYPDAEFFAELPERSATADVTAPEKNTAPSPGTRTWTFVNHEEETFVELTWCEYEVEVSEEAGLDARGYCEERLRFEFAEDLVLFLVDWFEELELRGFVELSEEQTLAEVALALGVSEPADDDDCDADFGGDEYVELSDPGYVDAFDMFYGGDVGPEVYYVEDLSPFYRVRRLATLSVDEAFAERIKEDPFDYAIHPHGFVDDGDGLELLGEELF